MGAGVAGTALVAGGLWYFQTSLIYPAYLPDGSRTRQSIFFSHKDPETKPGCTTASLPFLLAGPLLHILR